MLPDAPLRFLPHRAVAAVRALALRSSADIFSARAFRPEKKAEAAEAASAFHPPVIDPDQRALTESCGWLGMVWYAQSKIIRSLPFWSVPSMVTRSTPKCGWPSLPVTRKT